MITSGAVMASRPVRIAVPLPWLTSWCLITTRGSSEQRFTAARVPSVEQSSTTTTCWTDGSCRTRRMTRSIDRSSLKAGTITPSTRVYKRSVELGLDVVAVMAGDGQMDPNDLTLIIEPVTSGKADYSKGNRLFTGEAWRKTPAVRYLGNAFLSMLTKIASGYWHV